MFAMESRFWLVPCAALVWLGTLNERGAATSHALRQSGCYFGLASSPNGEKENKMRMGIAAIVATTASVAMAGEIEDAHRQAVAGRDSYWNCLAREYSGKATRAGRGRISLPISRACVLPKGRIFGLRWWITFRCNPQALTREHL
jgi:hypothetical protein